MGVFIGLSSVPFFSKLRLWIGYRALGSRVIAADDATEGLVSPAAPVETASNSYDDDDLGLILIPEDFFEAGRVVAAGDTTKRLLSSGTAATGGLDVGGGDGEAGNTVPLSLSTPGTFGNLSSLPLMTGTDSPPVFL